MVKQLEEHFGFELFERIGRRVRLTDKGKSVYERAATIFAAVDELQKSTEQIKQVVSGLLVLGAADVIASEYLPKRIQDLCERYPLVYPNLYSGPASMLMPKIESGELELGVFFHLPRLGNALELIKRVPIRFHLVVSKQEEKNRRVLESFIGSREIDDVANKRFPTLERHRKNVPGAKISTSSNNLVAHKNLVLSGAGVSILPDFLVNADLKRGTLKDLYPRERFEFDLKVVKRRTRNLSLSAQGLIELIG